MYLIGRDLSGINLKNATLSESSLHKTNFAGAILDGVNLSGLRIARALNVKLTGTHSSFCIKKLSYKGIEIKGHKKVKNLTGLRLYGARFTDLVLIDFINSDLRKSSFHGIVKNVNFSGSNLSDVKFASDGISASDTTFQDVNLSNTDLRHAIFFPIKLMNVTFDYADLSYCQFKRGAGHYWQNVAFNNTKFVGVDLRDFRYYGEYNGVLQFKNTDFTNAKMAGGNFSDCDFTGANFSAAHLVEFHRDGRPKIPVFHRANFQDAIFGKRVNIVAFIRANLESVNFSGIEVYIGVRELTEACLDRLLNHRANNNQSLLMTIDKLNDTALKVNLMGQLIDLLRTPGTNLQPFLKNFDILFQSDYFNNQTIKTFFIDVLAPEIIASANSSPWKMSNNNAALLADTFLTLLENKRHEDDRLNFGKDEGAFSKFVLRNNGFFIQFIHQIMANGNAFPSIQERAKKEYKNYLELKRIRDDTPQSHYIFGNLSGDADWPDKNAKNYVLVADSETEPQTPKKTLILSEKQLTAMLHNDTSFAHRRKMVER